jgi:hypothetical protein
MSPKTKALLKLFGCWIVTFGIGYALSLFSSLLVATLVILVGVFVVSTIICYRNRSYLTKSNVKAMDCVTIFTFITGILAVTDIDTQTYRERAQHAASIINDIQQDLQKRLNSQLDHCDDFKIDWETMGTPEKIKGEIDKIKSYFLPAFFRPYIFCRLLLELRGTDLGRVSLNRVDNRAGLAVQSFNFGLIPRNVSTLETVKRLQEYRDARRDIEQGNPVAPFISKTFAYLLVAFAFAVRLTRTTLEVREWHTP